MEKLTYRQAYDKIIEAYFGDQIRPMESNFCFCGTLCDNTSDWAGWIRNKDSHGYTGRDFDTMEQALFKGIRITANKSVTYLMRHEGVYEDALFAGMSAALDVLKKIHRSRGENVGEDMPAFTKRELVKAV